MKRILLSLGMIVFVGGVVAGATGAFFSDTETSTGNTFAAGDIDLKIDNTSYVTNTAGVLVASEANSWALDDLAEQLFFSFEDVKPGDIGEDTISIHPGSNDAYACMAADITATPDNGINEPEGDAGDVTDGVLAGELQNFLIFSFWEDDGDNVYEVGEVLLPDLQGTAASVFDGGWNTIADSSNGPALPGGSTTFVGKAWCFGTLTPNNTAQDELNTSGPLVRGTGFTCDGSGDNNIAQTDGITVDVSFYAVQARNNGQFTCSGLPTFNGDVRLIEVTTEDLGLDSWFFYNDTNDTVMSINQFSATGGVNDIVAGPLAVGAAQMMLDDGTQSPDYDGANDAGNPRYNIATTQYGGTKLADVGSLNYRIYDDSASAQTPYLHFNIDFNDSNTWQSRLVQVPTGVVVDTWTTVDALAGSWTYSGANWPAPIGGAGTTAHTWAEILAAYPNAELNDGGLSFLGVRVGHPGPVGENSYVDWIEFDGVTSDFEI